jgi:hypothetical protein
VPEISTRYHHQIIWCRLFDPLNRVLDGREETILM